MRRYGLGNLTPPRIVPDEETLCRALDRFVILPESRFVNGVLVGLSEMHRRRMRLHALRAWLARRLARLAIEEALAVVWRGCAREAVYAWRMNRRAYLYTRSEGR